MTIRTTGVFAITETAAGTEEVHAAANVIGALSCDFTRNGFPIQRAVIWPYAGSAPPYEPPVQFWSGTLVTEIKATTAAGEESVGAKASALILIPGEGKSGGDTETASADGRIDV